MKKIYVFLTVVIMLALLFVFTGCTKKETNNAPVKTNSSNTKIEKASNEVKNETQDEENETDYASFAKEQMAEPKKGETIAIIKVKDMGEIKVKFFKNIAPKAVENFINHAKEGYYDGLIFHRVIDEFMIQGGDPTGTGTGGESIWGKGFGTELDKSLVPYRGSLCMAMSSMPNSIGSQFFITQANYSKDMESILKRQGYDEDLLEQYKQYGGYLSLYMKYTVFGQVFEGLDVVDKIAKVETYSEEEALAEANEIANKTKNSKSSSKNNVVNESEDLTPKAQADKPKQDVVIEKITVTTY